MSENEGEVLSRAVEVAGGVCSHKVESCHLIVCGSHIALMMEVLLSLYALII